MCNGKMKIFWSGYLVTECHTIIFTLIIYPLFKIYQNFEYYPKIQRHFLNTVLKMLVFGFLKYHE